jgi:hypothetical protein
VFQGSISTVLDIAPGRARGEARARLFLSACLGLAVPVLGLDVATQTFSTPTAPRFSAVLAAVIGLVGRHMLANRPA